MNLKKNDLVKLKSTGDVCVISKIECYRCGPDEWEVDGVYYSRECKGLARIVWLKHRKHYKTPYATSPENLIVIRRKS